ncbi:ParB/RepB/Spo0J family partition protein [Streptomyces albidoflavus]|uniref:ParB/RepB/Spo0J family partition protein n=1 Tax=Streptomyces albidoflavus TaxID=1886 RepID=UPI0033D81458
MTGIAEKVGESSSFGRRARSARGRAKALTEGAIPAYELVRLPLKQVAPTPLNPRRNFGTDEEKTRFGEELRQSQLAACVVVTREAYLKLWPDHEATIGAAQHVLLNGERRYRSGLHVGLDSLDFVVRDDLAATKEDFVDNLLAENLDREDFDVVERARGVEQLVQACAETDGERGAKSRAATRLGRDRSWVTNQLVLLTLPIEIQVMLSAGEVSERDGRVLARHLKEQPGLDAVQLLAHLTNIKEAAEKKKDEEQRLLAVGRAAEAQAPSTALLSADNKHADGPEAPSAEPASLSADNEAASGEASLSREPVGSASPADLLSADNIRSQADGAASGARSVNPHGAGARAEQAHDPVPTPRTEQPSAEGDAITVFPFHDGAQAATVLKARMDGRQLLVLVDTLNELVARSEA